jgi:hypothetical protein
MCWIKFGKTGIGAAASPSKCLIRYAWSLSKLDCAFPGALAASLGRRHPDMQEIGYYD